MSIRILHLADLHLGASFPSLGERAEERARDFLSGFLRAVDYAAGKEKPVDIVAIAGDLFDTHDPDEGLVYQVESALDRLHGAGIPVLLAPGTHDAPAYRRSVYRRLRLSKSAHLFVTPTLEPGPRLEVRGESVQTYGIAYDASICQRPLAEFRPNSLADYQVAVLHAALQDSPTWKIRSNDLPVNRSEIAACGLHYLALGHYHNFAEVREGTSVAVYPGTLEGRKFGENGPRYLVVATIGRESVSIERTPWNARTLTEATIDFSLAEIREERQLEERILAFAGDREIVRVRLEGPAEFVFDAERLVARVRPRFFNMELDDRTYVVNARLMERYKDEATVRGVFVRRMLERIERAQGAEAKETATLALRLGLSEFQNPRHAP
ncbi:MAG TPA: DNA repair exonuclease [Candidatus Eisenbacteria bacterium]|nr:DNA repair exonuclease [Candidatus Eisenbacteria bacterium]